MNTIQIDENKLYDFLDEKVKPKWIESCQSNSSLSGWVKRMYYQDGDLFITDSISNNTWLEGDNLVYLGNIDSYIEIELAEGETENSIDYDIEWSNWGREYVLNEIEMNAFENGFELV